MRSTILGAALVLGSTLALSAAPDPKGPKPDVGDGRIAWFDITTTDMAKSKDFYGKLFGWQFTGLKGTDLAAEIVSDGRPIGTLRRAEGKISPFDGVVYVQVKDMPASCAKAKELGGTIPEGFPFDLSDGKGAVAVLVDPAGHPVGMYSRTPLAAAAK